MGRITKFVNAAPCTYHLSDRMATVDPNAITVRKLYAASAL